MKTAKTITLLCAVLLLSVAAQGQDKVMRVHSGGEVVYAANTAQVDSITFQDGDLKYPKEIPIEDYSLTSTSCQWQWINIGFEEVIVINGDYELENYIQCTDGSYPEIDFSKYTLLLAGGGGTSGISALEKQLRQISISEYSLLVDITRNATAIAEGWFISVKIPKLFQNNIITLDVNDRR